jgi:beta-phosphoglucomutase family hydrolase
MIKQFSASMAAVIFDMDGTLIDSTEADYLAWKRTFADYGIELTYPDYFPLLGKRSSDVATSVLHLNEEKAAEALQKKADYFTEIITQNGINTIPHALDFVAAVRARKLKIALATSSRKSKMKLVLERTGLLPFFDVLVSGDEVINGKPAPDIFLMAAERLGVEPAGCLVVEDAVNGVLAAKRAGMQCLAITTTHAADQLHDADMVVDSFANLVPIL